ncbi:glycine cleavage system protein GcvH [Legionella impletisoli]|uniref:Glycine cleavage system H protein n=1 Tax=Legionella impletisoli TaxID=343510 RepID=A0A917JW84_9GAMM|nr:glycine cleavage system protein GcvH [Legionella impletisoli]GGI87501.1 glycine cleavage system H protein [Legionella impletisoli]
MSDVPANLKFTETHEWILFDKNEATIGITDHAQELLGDLVFVDLPEVGNTVSSGDELGVVESVKAASDFYTPISGIILAVNPKVCEDPALVNQDPYGKGWLVKIKPSSPAEVENLLDAAAYEQEISEEE